MNVASMFVFSGNFWFETGLFATHKNPKRFPTEDTVKVIIIIIIKSMNLILHLGNQTWQKNLVSKSEI